MTPALVFIAIAGVWLLGACTLALLDARGQGASGIVADWATGVVALAFLGISGIVMGAGVSMLGTYLVIAALGVACALSGSWRRLPDVTELSFPTRDRVAAATLALTVAVVVLILSSATHDRLWWDGWSIWAFKARVLLEEGSLPARFLDPSGPYVTANLDYPLAVPLLDWWVYRHIGEASPAAVSFIGAAWYALLPALAWSGLRPAVGARDAALAALGIAAFWPIAFYAAGGAADVVIAVALLGAALEVTRTVRVGGRAGVIRATAYLALAALSKNEGLALAIIAVPVFAGALLLRPSGERSLVRLGWLAVPPMLSAPWLLYVRSLSIGSPALSDVTGASDAVERASMLFLGLRVLFTSSPWIGASLIVVAGLWGLARSKNLYVLPGAALLALYISALCTVYVRSSADMLWLLTTAAPRVFGATVPALVCVSLLAIHGRTPSEPHSNRSTETDAVPV